MVFMCRKMAVIVEYTDLASSSFESKHTTLKMSLLPYPFSALTLIVGTYVMHTIWSRRRVQRAIANVPAPKSASFWTGTYCLAFQTYPSNIPKLMHVRFLGNLPLLYDPHRGWPFLDSIQDGKSHNA